MRHETLVLTAVIFSGCSAVGVYPSPSRHIASQITAHKTKDKKRQPALSSFCLCLCLSHLPPPVRACRVNLPHEAVMVLLMKALTAFFALFQLNYVAKAAPPASHSAGFSAVDTDGVLDSAAITSCGDLLRKQTVGFVGTVTFASRIECATPVVSLVSLFVC